MSNDLVVPNSNNKLTSLDVSPDYLRGETAGSIGNLDRSDYQMPRIKLLQANSPECRSFPGIAIPGQFWHTGANKSLGTRFNMVVCTVLKRAIVWSARGTNSEMLAYSPDAKMWAMGGNQKHTITLKDNKTKVEIHTRNDVNSSNLLNWGSSDPSDPKSSPVATLIYEYLTYLPETPEMSPCMLGTYRTATDNAKKLNTSLLMLRSSKKPHQSVAVECFADEESNDGNHWFVPNFKLAGYVSKEHYWAAKDISESEQDRATNQSPVALKETTVTLKDDEIPF